jgi:hypothetical protein
MSIPLYRYDFALLDFIGQRQALRLERDGCAKVVRHKKGHIARVILHRRPSDPRRDVRIRDYSGQAYSFLQELDAGLECWKLRPLQGGSSDSTLAPPELRPLFLAVVRDCMVGRQEGNRR